jgi:primosomal protein N'
LGVTECLHYAHGVVARVTLELAIRKEFDYAIPPTMAAQIDVGTRVKVPFGPRQVNGVVTELIEESTHTNLRPITKVISAPSLVTPKVLKLARWIADYYCCAPEIALKSVLPEAVRKEDAGFRERLFVRLAAVRAKPPKLTERQQEILNVVEEWRELPLQRLLTLTGATPATVRKLEDKGLIVIAPQIDERDPYAKEEILPTEPLKLNEEQARALEAIKAVMTKRQQSAASVSLALPETVQAQPSSLFFERNAETHKYRGWLPHWRQSDKLYFVTFRLHDSAAQADLQKWLEEKRIWERLHPEPWSERDTREYHKRFTDRIEQLLDSGHGECLLRNIRASEIVERALRYFDGDRYQLGDFVVMPNHVHALVRPQTDNLEEVLHTWKSFTAKEINSLLGREGKVWREEYFDHLVRSREQFTKFQRYIAENPVKARLAAGQFRVGKGTFELPSPTAPNAAVADKRQQDAGGTLLLHGVTGSGKTEVYLQAIAHALEQGKGAIVLVPEISLTPQTVERFKARFSSGPLRTLVAVLHSHLSAGERHDEWHKIRQGRARIVIGARSAIFAPVDPLGLIIVDEEHEHSYKQEESPRYHARDVAVVRGQMEGAVVVLGSATPSMESYHNAQRGKYELLSLPTRVDDQKMPIVRVVDMRSEGRKQKGIPIFSQQLKEAITQRLERREQTILFLNRRGYSTSLQCPDCGYVAECPNCSVSLTYHRRAALLMCHICSHTTTAPRACPERHCGNAAIRYSGLGTEKVEDTLAKLFPHARVTRMDSDTLKRKEDYRRILGDFRAGKIDILVGTQMIAKGLHFPNVTLVGIIYADLSLHMPDFRAGERTFQLLTQVAGRAGRGDIEGEVFVQAFTPFHPAIQYARRHDFTGFYEQEIEFREQLRYPPLARIALLTLRGRNEEKVKLTATHVRSELQKLVEQKAANASAGESASMVNAETNGSGYAIPDLVIAGPAPAPLAKAETYYRYQIMLRTRAMTKLSRAIAHLQTTLALPDDVQLAVDIDPVDLA